MEQRGVSGQRWLCMRWLWWAHSLTSVSKLIEYTLPGEYPNISTGISVLTNVPNSGSLLKMGN